MLIHTVINILEKIFFAQIDPKNNNLHFNEIQSLITKSLYDLNESKCGVDLLDELEKLTMLKANIQNCIKYTTLDLSKRNNKRNGLDQIEEEPDSLCESSCKKIKKMTPKKTNLNYISLGLSTKSNYKENPVVQKSEKSSEYIFPNKLSNENKENIEINKIIICNKEKLKRHFTSKII